jgi:hypothetical protein
MLPCVARTMSEVFRNKKSFVGSPRNQRLRIRMATASPNILVVEDDRETRTLIAKYLRTNSCNVTTAADGREWSGRRPIIASTF